MTGRRWCDAYSSVAVVALELELELESELELELEPVFELDLDGAEVAREVERESVT